MTDTTDSELETLAPARLAEMLREKRRAEANLRDRLRETEARAVKAEQAVQGWQAQAFQDFAQEAGVAKTALADVGALVQLPDLVDEDGLLNHELAGEALTALKAERPHLFAQHQGTGEGGFTGAGQELEPQETTWADVIA